jgi:hypothetical protein
MEISIKASESESTLQSTLNEECNQNSSFYEEIEKLTSLGINASDIKKLVLFSSRPIVQ